MVPLVKGARPKPNPYVGPRPFRAGDELYGRDRELRALRDTLIAERIVLLHSPSGAGKTSLIQAALGAELERKGFEVLGPLRVGAAPPDDGVNRYLWSVLVGLRGVSVEDANVSIATALDRLDEQDSAEGRRVRRVLVLDQFEEVLTINPADVEGQEGFFRDLGLALEKDHRWALLSMREDYMGGLARYAAQIPTHLHARFRLDFLGHAAAIQAVQQPPRALDVQFKDDAAKKMVEDLAVVRVQVPGAEEPDLLPSPYVEPFQLQVVCARLWQKLQRQGGRFVRIEKRHVEKYADFEKAMSSYYADAVAEVAGTTGASERAIRDWVEEHLITKQGFRRQTTTGPETAPNVDVGEVLSELEDRYVIRLENRRGTNWYELAHDNLVSPVRNNNAAWRQRNLDPWEWAADAWNRSGRQEEYLARGPDVRAARLWLKQRGNGNELVREYVDASAAAQGRTLVARLGLYAAILVCIALAELLVIILLLVL